MCSVPFIGLVIFGENFFGLWLQALTADEVHTVAILSVLTILPQLFSMYFFPLYNVNTITTKIKAPVIITVVQGVLSVIIVYLLLKLTNWGIYVVAGVSSVLNVLYILFFVPVYAAYTIGASWYTFYKPLIRGQICNVTLVVLFSFVRLVVPIHGWASFFVTCIIAACLGYSAIFFILFNKEEQKKLFYMVKSKLRKRS